MLRAAVWLLFADGSRGVTGLVRRDLPRGRPRLLRRKLGLAAEHEADAELAQDLLTRMAESHADFTLSFRLLCAASADTEGDAAVRALFADGCTYDAWAARWRRRMTEDTLDPDARSCGNGAANPAYISRNHLVEAALDAAVSRQDFAPFKQLLEVLSRPFEERSGCERYAALPAPEERVQQTFCGT
jgi:uncharacterized protein YdiU (UPF0061 family)